MRDESEPELARSLERPLRVELIEDFHDRMVMIAWSSRVALVSRGARRLRLMPTSLHCLRTESLGSWVSIMAFRSDRSLAARTFFEKFLLNDEFTNLAFQAGGLCSALFDVLAGSILPLEKLAHAFLQLLFPGTHLRWGDILIDGDLLDGFFLP